ncbi:MAG: hypothetical protein ABJG47_11695 [Ekhidna sp.]
MKTRFKTIRWFGILLSGFILLSAFNSTVEYPLEQSFATDLLKKEAFKILDTKCNVCHRKKNPLMIFKEKNMVKRAPKIYKMVFIERKMPKGNEIKLTGEEYSKLEKWLFTQQIF